MKILLSCVMITKNAQETIERSLRSVKDLADEIVAVDDHSTDQTRAILERYGVRVILRRDDDLGRQKAFGISRSKGGWILILDSDEIISDELKGEIQRKLHTKYASAYFIPYQNHFLGRAIRYGGENYKMLRLFKKDAVEINPSLVHEHVTLKKGKAPTLRGKLLHYSYRSLSQMYRKFTDYALREARQKIKNGERSSVKKIILYPIHMFWVRFIMDKGYRDGWFRIPLDLGFAYMEFLTYLKMAL